MPLHADTLKRLAEHLETAELQARAVTKITDDHPDMTWDDAYAIQSLIEERKIARGHRTVGLKCGLTSHAKMKQMGVSSPCFGFLSDYMACAEGSDIDCSTLIHPKVEAEICVVTKRPLKGPGCHIGDVLSAVDFALAGAEIIDSRYRDFKFDLKSVIADNTSASRFVVGGRGREADDLDWRTLGVVMEKNGKIEQMAAGAAVLGHPCAAVAMLANHLGARNSQIPAGCLILTGGVTEAIAVKPGDHVCVRIQHLGALSMRFV